MSNEPPFQPPEPDDPGQFPPPAGHPPPAGSAPPPQKGRFRLGGGYSLLGLFFGFAIGLGLPPAVFGLGLGILNAFNVEAAVGIVVMVVVAVLVPVAIIIFLSRRLNRSDESQASVRTAIVAAGFASLFIWVVLSLLLGACIALLTSAS